MGLMCPKEICKVIVILKDKYCVEHGLKLIPIPKCPECNNELYPSDKFCGSCGNVRT